MAQGAGLKKKSVIVSKSKTSPAGSKGRVKGSANTMKKGKLLKVSKKTMAVKHTQLQKKLAANLTASLEQAMAVKAGAVGKLTIMKDAQNKGKSMEVKRRKY
ncbi:hypothetical protein LPJ62_007042 [Coemansia sp. RSA 2167]|nr:hypothetical protein LPJ58_005793 [Coemansia sp. RSA 1591]KAJ1751843.1 hypothetical protein LPJ69_005801 [Coemansia sp. RSA 1752]KAJ1774712.1 hypothetical protein LPJ62_007042 [Coemansia sp. RSA 2167]KAJ1780962.1 hypothetical protein LPJ67_005687 [Coemansia sp. RSA 1938]KAJ2127675.1 hypothetical protein GGF48_003176 [Coemansia sp. RSA 921]KAJ2148663.1 hypothetical protein IW142_000758 [Coemansia sp. RSA 564]KAJ2182986.1 hypothetical protein GGF45_000393 [Coemansia sp. RSA 551]KAJ2196495.1